MNIPKILLKAFCGCLLASLLLFGDLPVAAQETPRAWGETVGGLREPQHIFGSADPFAMHLPVGSTFSIPVDLDNEYWPAEPLEVDYKFESGTYFLEAQFTGRSLGEGDLDPIWTGTVTSNQLRFEVPRR